MSSNSVKIDGARKWHRQLDNLNQADVVRNAPWTAGELDDVCNVCALAKITKTLVPRVAETQAEEKLERVFTDVIGPFRAVTVRIPVQHCVCRPVFEICVCGLA